MANPSKLRRVNDINPCMTFINITYIPDETRGFHGHVSFIMAHDVHPLPIDNGNV